jgi:O-antigen/teichoic acid export membrane protein
LGVAALAAGLLVLLAAAVLALATLMPAWGAALVVGGAVTALGVLLLMSSKAKLSRVNLKPEQTIDSVQSDVSAIKKAAT